MVLPGTIAALAALRYGIGALAYKQENRLEHPIETFKVIEHLNRGVEVRRYPPHTVAVSTIKEPNSMEIGRALGIHEVYKYIQGNNVVQSIWGKTTAKNITMHFTIPVETTVHGFDKRRGTAPSAVSVAVIMGSEYHKAHYPTPMGNVRIQHVPARYLAVQSFHGQIPSRKVVQRRRNAIIDSLRHSPYSQKFVPQKETVLLGYHDPILVPGVIRKNEVGVVLEQDQTELIRVLTTPYGVI